MNRQQNLMETATSRIVLGFIGSGILFFAFNHPQISYVALLAASAFLCKQPVERIESYFHQTVNRWRFFPISVGILAFATGLLKPFPAHAQWNEAKDAATSSFGSYISADIITLLFTAVFLILFFLIVGGLMAWGYKAFRNEDAAVPMTAFIVGVIIFIGGEVFSKLFFGGT